MFWGNVSPCTYIQTFSKVTSDIGLRKGHSPVSETLEQVILKIQRLRRLRHDGSPECLSRSWRLAEGERPASKTDYSIFCTPPRIKKSSVEAVSIIVYAHNRCLFIYEFIYPFRSFIRQIDASVGATVFVDGSSI